MLLLVLVGVLLSNPEKTAQTSTTATTMQTPTTAALSTVASTEPSAEPPTEPPTEPPYSAGKTADSDPENWGTSWEIMADGEMVESYERQEEIFFEEGDYFALPGVASFRGGNYRNDPGYGTADITEGSITELWHMNVGYLSEAEWIGCGWTGQPLVVQWDEETKAIMNLYEDKKNKENLVEVIYAKMDGYIHFIDMEDGSFTRDPLYVGMVFKGSGALDPRGYPLLYVGSGLQQGNKMQTMFIISLIDGSILYEYSGYDSFANRRWYAFDSSPLVDADTDTLIWPGESGVLYTFKLNTQYDPEAGTVFVTPDEPVRTRYTHDYRTKQGRNIGYEASAVAVEDYLYLADNAGMLQCVNINTMELVWAQDIIDDVNSTPLFDWGADGNGYLYIAPSLDYSNGGTRNELPICKIDARTGEILWTYSMVCYTYDGVSGGTLASPLTGRAGSDIEDLIIFTVGRSPTAWDGRMVALDKETGQVVWQADIGNYGWSSPVALYTEEGKAYIFQADASGHCTLFEGATGKVLDTLDLKQTVEASPVVFGDRVILGTRSRIYLFDIS